MRPILRRSLGCRSRWRRQRLNTVKAAMQGQGRISNALASAHPAPARPHHQMPVRRGCIVGRDASFAVHQYSRFDCCSPRHALCDRHSIAPRRRRQAKGACSDGARVQHFPSAAITSSPPSTHYTLFGKHFNAVSHPTICVRVFSGLSISSARNGSSRSSTSKRSSGCVSAASEYCVRKAL